MSGPEGGGARGLAGVGPRNAWVVATEARLLPATVATARGAGGAVTVVAVGDRTLADAAAAAGPDDVLWLAPDEGVPAEAYAAAVADAAAEAAPGLLLATAAAAARALLAAAAVRLGAPLVPGVTAVRAEGDSLVVERSALEGRVVQTVAVTTPLAAIAGPSDDVPPPAGVAPSPVTALAVGAPADLRVEDRHPAGAPSGVTTAARVVSFGRGVRARADVALVEQLAGALRAEVACSMPIADNLGWVAKDRYVGRSGQHIAPRLYLAVGISGTPQHMEGVRDAKVVAAINSDRNAAIFRSADYGVVGDLYEVVPALVAALTS